MKLETGKSYVNKRGDVCGPMEERTPGVWLDQHGGVYHPDGTQWNHVPESTANLMRERTCTCHPDDNPPKPCTQKYALTECRDSASAS